MKLLEVYVSSLIFTNIGFSLFLKPKNYKSSDIVLPIFIGPLETHSITNVLHKKKISRPMTHDLLFDILNKCSVNVAKVVIDRVVDNTFYSVICLNKNSDDSPKDFILVDSRTSDAIAIALRSMSPIYVAESIVEELGISLKDEDWFKDATFIHEEENIEGQDYLRDLQDKLQKAIKDRNYELAAEIRDKINEITSS